MNANSPPFPSRKANGSPPSEREASDALARWGMREARAANAGIATSVCLACALLLAGPLQAQGFAGLGSGAEGFALPRPDAHLSFPRDHGPHPAFRVEWWYLTANLETPDGAPYGLQWTLFRTALAPGRSDGWDSPQLWMAHAAVTAPDGHHVAERLARDGIGQAGVTQGPFDAWIDDWRMTGSDDLSRLDLVASGSDFSYSVRLEADGPLVFHGEDGYSVKSAEGQASRYYSQPFYRVEGALDLPQGSVEVAGQAWLDREWSSQPLSEDQSGWDWFSLHLDGGEKLMGFRLRGESSGAFTAATWIAPDGAASPYPDGALSAEPLDDTVVEGRRIPTRWRIRLPDRSLDVEVEAINPQAWMSTRFPYWEGPVAVAGTHSGRGYLEMTGYE